MDRWLVLQRAIESQDMLPRLTDGLHRLLMLLLLYCSSTRAGTQKVVIVDQHLPVQCSSSFADRERAAGPL